MSCKTLRAYSDVSRSLQRIADLILILASHALLSAPPGSAASATQGGVTIFALVAFIIVAELLAVYRPRQPGDFIAEVTPVLLAWILSCAALAVFVLAGGGPKTPAAPFPIGWCALAAVFLAGGRAADRTLRHALSGRGSDPQQAAIFGATPAAEHLCHELQNRPHVRLVGVYDDRKAGRRHVFTDGTCPVAAGGFPALLAACRRGEIESVYVALPMPAEKRIRGMLRALADTTASVFLVAHLPSYDLLRARWTSLGSCPLISIHDTPFRGVAALLKRVEDIAVGVVALLLIALPMVVISILVKLTSRGPVFFRQRRHGLNGGEFRVLKFRTMTVSEDGPTIKQAQRNDPRVTPLGRLLRRTSLDELPQFWQVVTGEMSVVGPRPHAVAHNEHYRSLVPRYMLRHKVKPGITGWAQVNGWRGETASVESMEKRVEHDLEYVDHWSLLLDIKILFKTIWSRRTHHNAF